MARYSRFAAPICSTRIPLNPFFGIRKRLPSLIWEQVGQDRILLNRKDTKDGQIAKLETREVR